MQLEKILIATDFSAGANAALSYAAFLARQYRAELHLLHVVVLYETVAGYPEAIFPDTGQIQDRIEEMASSKMKALLADLQDENFRVREERRRAIAAAPAIVDYAAEEDIDLIILGTRGLRRLLFGSVAEEVVRTAACPVLTIRDEEAARTVETIERIVVPFDFSTDSEKALATARELAATYGSSIDLVHVVAPLILPSGQGLVVPGLVMVDLVSGLEEALARRVSAIDDRAVKIEPCVLQGPIASKIIDFAADRGADLIVIGSHGLRGLRRFLLGSVAERVVRSSHCPVLVMRSAAKEKEK